MFRRRTALVLTVLLAVLASSLSAAPVHAAGTITVDRNDDSNDVAAAVCSAAGNDCSLRGAVKYANTNAGATIMLPAGNYNLTLTGSNENLSATGDLDIRASGTVIQGAGAGSTFLRWDPNVAEANRDRVIEINPNVVAGFNFSLSGVTISGGREQTGIGGGGMISGSAAGTGGSVTLTDCAFYDNRVLTTTGSPVGGAIGHAGGSLTITNCAFDGNQSRGSGGALYFDPYGSGSLTITNSTFTNNTSLAGGGAIRTGVVTAASGPATISGSRFASNRAQGVNGTGGAIYNESGNLTVSTSSFENNQVTNATGGRGGAIGSSDGAGKTVTVQFSRLVGNTAATAANGMAIYGGSGSTMHVDDNWWGVNTGPGANVLAGAVAADRWLQLRNTASPAAVLVGSATTLTADLFGRNTGGPVAAAALAGLPAFPTPVSPLFGQATRGTLANIGTQFVNGLAMATYTATTCGNGGATASADAAVTSAVIEVQCLDLVVSKTHSGDFRQGDQARSYTITVSNTGTTASGGIVSVVDTLPSGLAATAIGGTGWACTLATVTCTRSDTLGVGANYPPLTVTVDVAINAPAQIVNTATVVASGESDTSNNTASDPTSITPLARSVNVAPTQLALREGGAPATYLVSLAVAPTADVVITMTTDAQVTANPTTLTFTSANWHVPQPVVVGAVDNTVVEPERTSTISHSAASADSSYNGISIPDVVATITDNDSVPTSRTYRAYLPMAQSQ